MTVTFEIIGLPKPKGSKSAFVRGGRAVLVEGGPQSAAGRAQHAAWKKLCAFAAETVRGDVRDNLGMPYTGPVAVTVTFRLPRPKTETRAQRARVWHTSKPDWDKLARAVGDALPGRIIVDDAQIARGTVEKRYVMPGERIGCTVTVSTMAETD